MNRSEKRTLCALLAVASALACSTQLWHARFTTGPAVDVVDDKKAFLKVHTHTGDVFVLSTWSQQTDAGAISGNGFHYDASRVLVGDGAFQIPIDDVALLETNRPETVVHAGVAVMGVLTGASLTLSALCLSAPKACFGSCPTFYAFDGEHDVLQAEGFSAAIAPSLEATDVDALYLAKPRATDTTFQLKMTNEAPETHAVNRVRLLAAPRPPGGRVLHTRSGFIAARSMTAPSACASGAGDCLRAVRAVDDAEYRSFADAHDLATKETVELVFPKGAWNGEAKLGVVVRGRNTLMQTFLFYQTLAWAGRAAGEWLMQLEHGGKQAQDMFGGQGALLGDVDVEVLNDGTWTKAGFFSEVGPIAREVQLVQLPPGAGRGVDELKVRLIMAAGNWRIDHVALAALGDNVTPQVLDPVRVTHDGVDDPRALALLTGDTRHLMTFPGDKYLLTFDAPPPDSELFLEARGYYLEWMREQWMLEESPERMTALLLDPRDTLRSLAPAFKKLEPSMEDVFWKSGYAP